MGTLIDAGARITDDGRLVPGTGFRRAATSAFAYDTGTVHAGPGGGVAPPPYPQFFSDRVFFLLYGAQLSPERIARHRRDNGLRRSSEFSVLTNTDGRRSRALFEHRDDPPS